MLPAALLYVYAGVQISTLNQFQTSPELLILLFLIGIFPYYLKIIDSIEKTRNVIYSNSYIK